MKIQIQSDFDALVNSFNNEIDKFGQAEDNPVLNAALQWCNTLIEQVRLAVIKHDLTTDRRNLLQSFTPIPVKIDGKEIEVNIVAADYWAFKEYGVKGWEKNQAPNSPFQFKKKQLPHSTIIDWLEHKPTARAMFTQNLQLDVPSIAVILARSIPRKGFKPKPFVEPALTSDMLTMLSEMISEALGVKVSAVFRNAK